MMNILLLGANGQLGWELQRSLLPLGVVTALGKNSAFSPNHSQALSGDLSNLASLENTVRMVSPDIIVNAAAYTAVDQAESDRTLAQVINADAPTLLAKLAKELNAWLIHYSTDYVFDGSTTSFRKESDYAKPINVYGETKLDGEKGIAINGDKYIIFRTSWVYGSHGNNFLKTILRLAEHQDSLNVVNDQIGAPTSAAFLADASAHVIRKIQTQPELRGLYHLTGAGETNWCDYAKFLINEAKNLGVSLKLKAQNIRGIPSSDYITPAERPHNSRLDCSKFKNSFDLCLPDWRIQVSQLVRDVLQSAK